MLRYLLAKLLNSPDLAGGRVVEWHLGWGASVGTAALALGLLAAAGASIVLYRRQHRVAGRRWQVGLGVLRGLTFAALLLLLCQPVLSLTKTGVVKGACPLLVDRTKSMDTIDRLSHREMVTALKAVQALSATAPPDAPLGEGHLRRLAALSRFALVKEAVDRQAAGFLDGLDERFEVEVLTFGAQVAAAGEDAPPSPAPRGPGRPGASRAARRRGLGKRPPRCKNVGRPSAPSWPRSRARTANPPASARPCAVPSNASAADPSPASSSSPTARTTPAKTPAW